MLWSATLTCKSRGVVSTIAKRANVAPMVAVITSGTPTDKSKVINPAPNNPPMLN